MAHSEAETEKLSERAQAIALVWVMLPPVRQERAQMMQNAAARNLPGRPEIPFDI